MGHGQRHHLEVPGAVQNLSVTGTSQTALKITWETPAADGGTSITKYEVQVSAGESDSNYGTIIPVLPTAPLEHLESGLNLGDTRWFRVRAVNSVGVGH